MIFNIACGGGRHFLTRPKDDGNADRKIGIPNFRRETSLLLFKSILCATSN